jgi:glycosyltransferase involved in cell wall biosynthesis
MEKLYPKLNDKDLIIVYHYCDGWLDFERRLASISGRVIVRWHNNTPPWFFAKYSPRSVSRTIAGFESICRLAKLSNSYFACNSDFTARQLDALGIRERILPSVYPASRYLDDRDFRSKKGSKRRRKAELSILFVGRVVAHKGHRHIINVAARLQSLLHQDVVIKLPGRMDDNSKSYVDEIRDHSRLLEVKLELPGEVDSEELEQLYRNCDVFVCMSEHEGFGLPVYEAMAREVPVAVYNITAFPEILKNHPLAFSSLDYDEIAHKIMRLNDDQFRDRVLRYQREFILPTYTRRTVQFQLVKCLELASADIGAEADSEDLSQIPINEKVSEFEIINNFVTLYDLQAYSYLLEDRQSAGYVGNWLSQHIDARFFLSRAGRIASQAFICDDPGTGEHLVFGPYMSLVAGNYTVTFDVHIESEDAANVTNDVDTIVVDVNANGVHRGHSISVSQIVAGTDPSVDFTLTKLTSNIEFRVLIRQGRINKNWFLRFSGIILNRRMQQKSEPNNRFLQIAESSQIIRSRDSARAASLIVDAPSLEKQRVSDEGPGHAKDKSPGKASVSVVLVEDLTKIESSDLFLEACYIAILGREIDSDGRRHYGNDLANKRLSKKEVIYSLASSDEGKRRDIRLIG